MIGVVLYGTLTILKRPSNAMAAIEFEREFDDASLGFLYQDAIISTFFLRIFRLPAFDKSDSIAGTFAEPEGRFDQPQRGPPTVQSWFKLNRRSHSATS